jgi:hypothetical protein
VYFYEPGKERPLMVDDSMRGFDDFAAALDRRFPDARPSTEWRYGLPSTMEAIWPPDCSRG